jgi:hypothetical protein
MKLTILASVLFAALAIYLNINHLNHNIEVWMWIASVISFFEGVK